VVLLALKRKAKNVTKRIRTVYEPMPGDLVQYRNNIGVIMGYGLVTEKTSEGWYIILDNETGNRVYWSDHLMTRIIK
tara:strand:- start:27 stop:257 length:231 start_codon:yes stop_codon:yes gene_type:complete